MSEIPQAAIDAAAYAIECKLLTEPPDGCMTWLDADEQLARAALEAAERVWPHEPPKRDLASTTAASTERARPFDFDRRRPASFGFGPPGGIL